MEHGGDPIEQSLAGLDLALLHVAPGNGYAQRHARFAIGAGRRGESRNAMTSLATVTFRNVEGDRTESSSKLFAQVAIMMANTRDDGTKAFDGLDGEFQNLKRGGVVGRF
ncbi:hypothetical protein LVJ94_03915 [Pendulispora rubella]|uniref:Uncharacterized protein n=1 Tax=Pendulispora rubella TaxID=2741070 RepID=A0ABZ2L6K5_9BACT